MSGDEQNRGALPQAVIQKKKGISVVWVIPLVALIIAAGLAYKAITEKGPVVTISFKSAEGLEAGKTKIKHKDVVIGQVNDIKVSPDLTKVIVTAELVKEAEKYLTENTRFWVVRARFSGGMISGLGTLFSGGYIAIDPSLEGKNQEYFEGLEIPPVVTSDAPGRRFTLRASHLGSLDHGSPVYYKGIRAGHVEGYRFSKQDEEIEVQIFIEDPFHHHVFETTRFWFASGVEMVVDAKGVRIDTQSFVTMMIGGLVFSNPDDVIIGEKARESYAFPLYDSPEDAASKRYSLKEYYLLKFDESVRGLEIGAPVEFRGFHFGRVVDIGLEMEWGKSQIKIPVKIEVEPERIRQLTEETQIPDDAIQRLIDKGFRAQLRIGNFITGLKYISIDVLEPEGKVSMNMQGGLMEIPTVPAPTSDVTKDIVTLLDKVSKIPVEEIGTAALQTIQSFEETSRSLKKAGNGINGIVSSAPMKSAIDNLDQTLVQLRRITSEFEKTLPAVSEQTIATMEGIQGLTASDSKLVFELQRTLLEITRTARQITRLADQLERHPESILQGKGKK